MPSVPLQSTEHERSLAPKRPSPKFLQKGQVRMPMTRRVKTNPDKTCPIMRIHAVGTRADARGYGKTVAFLFSDRVANINRQIVA